MNNPENILLYAKGDTVNISRLDLGFKAYSKPIKDYSIKLNSVEIVNEKIGGSYYKYGWKKAVDLTVNNNSKLTFSVTDKANVVTKRTIDLKFIDPCFYGTNSSESYSPGEIDYSSLQFPFFSEKRIVTEKKTTTILYGNSINNDVVNPQENGHFWFAHPEDWGVVWSIKDQNGFDLTYEFDYFQTSTIGYPKYLIYMSKDYVMLNRYRITYYFGE